MTVTLLSLLLAADPGANPDWVTSGGTSGKYSLRTHLVGFGAAEGSDVDAARDQAARQVAQQISVRIESQASDVSAEKNGKGTYATTVFTKATTDVRISGLKYETHASGGKTYVLAFVARAQAASDRRAERDRAWAEAKETLARADRARAAKQETDAIRAYLAARTLYAEVMEHEAVARAIGGADDKSAALNDEVAAANAKIDEQVASALKTATATLEDCEASLGLQLSQQGVATGSKVVVAPLTYGTTSYSSVFGRTVATDLEGKIARSKLLGPQLQTRQLAIKGSYADLGDSVRVIVVAREVDSGRAVASGEASVKKAALPKDLSLVPQNLQQALVDQKILAQGEEVSGDLRVEVWTSKGTNNVVFSAKEEMKVFMRVNKPCYVRLVYLLASGMKVPLAQAYYIDQSKVNFAVEYPDTFEVTAPFGIERLHAVAFTEKPEPLPTVQQIVEGEKYDVVTETQALVKHRGIQKKKAAAQTAEAVVTLTTVPK